MVLREEPFRGALELPNNTVGNVKRRQIREGEPDARLCPGAQTQRGRRCPLLGIAVCPWQGIDVSARPSFSLISTFCHCS